MKFLLMLLTLAAGLVAAQDISDIPACAQPCIADAVSSATDCSVTDYKCICIPDNAQAIASAGAPCVVEKCGSEVAISTYCLGVLMFHLKCGC